MNLLMPRAGLGAFGVILVSLAIPAEAAILQYQLHNHPDALVGPPGYGARIDELFNATGGLDHFTFDFNHAQSNMRLNYDTTAQTIRIFGQAMGGRDIGTSHANDGYLGLYEFSFLYTIGVEPVPGDDDIWCDPPQDGQNSGFIQAPPSAGGQSFNLIDKGVMMHGYTLRFGNENNDLGHRGFPGLSGWGWFEIVGAMNPGVKRDWIFTGELIPEPSTMLMALVGFGAALLRRPRWR